MQEILFGFSWTAVIVGAVAAYILGALWYSPMLFSVRWQKGIGAPVVPNRSMMVSMITQFLATVLFSWVLVVAVGYSMALAILIAVTVAGVIKANGLFAGKKISSIAIETGYILAEAVVILLIQRLF